MCHSTLTGQQAEQTCRRMEEGREGGGKERDREGEGRNEGREMEGRRKTGHPLPLPPQLNRTEILCAVASLPLPLRERETQEDVGPHLMRPRGLPACADRRPRGEGALHHAAKEARLWIPAKACPRRLLSGNLRE